MVLCFIRASLGRVPNVNLIPSSIIRVAGINENGQILYWPAGRNRVSLTR